MIGNGAEDFPLELTVSVVEPVGRSDGKTAKTMVLPPCRICAFSPPTVMVWELDAPRFDPKTIISRPGHSYPPLVLPAFKTGQQARPTGAM